MLPVIVIITYAHRQPVRELKPRVYPIGQIFADQTDDRSFPPTRYSSQAPGGNPWVRHPLWTFYRLSISGLNTRPIMMHPSQVDADVP